MFLDILTAAAYILAIIFRIGAALGMGIVSLVLLVLAIFAGGSWATLGLVFAGGVICLILAVVFFALSEWIDER